LKLWGERGRKKCATFLWEEKVLGRERPRSGENRQWRKTMSGEKGPQR